MHALKTAPFSHPSPAHFPLQDFRVDRLPGTSGSESGCFLYGQPHPSLTYCSPWPFLLPCCPHTGTARPREELNGFLGNLGKALSLSGTNTALNQFTPVAVSHNLALTLGLNCDV